MSGIRVNEWLHNSGTGGIWQTSAGNVGIASSVPTTKLEVTGDAKISGVSTATAFLSSQGQLSHRRINMNGAMQVWQRSISASSVGGSNGYFAADRYRSSNNGSARHTISRDTDTPTGEGFGHSMKIDVTTAVASPSANNYTYIQHRIEGQDVAQFAKGTAGAKQYALSFWVKSPKTGVHVIQWEDVENSRSVQGTYTIASADTWEKHSIIFPADTSGGITCDNAHRMQLYFWLFAGSTYNDGNVNTLGTTWATTGSTTRASGQVNVFDNTSNNFYITGIQLEVGSVVTPFEHRSFADELARCQRYFYMIADGSVKTSAAIADGRFLSASEVDFMVSFPVTMRTQPSLYQVSGADYFKIMYHTYNQYVDGNWTIQYAQPNGCSHYATPDASGSADKPAQIVLQNSSARLGYTADL